MRIPWRKLPLETLENMLEEIVTRDGTDYGSSEKTTAEKVRSAHAQLVSGSAHLYWDAKLESASLLSTDQVAKLEKQATDRDRKIHSSNGNR